MQLLVDSDNINNNLQLNNSTLYFTNIQSCIGTFVCILIITVIKYGCNDCCIVSRVNNDNSMMKAKNVIM